MNGQQYRRNKPCRLYLKLVKVHFAASSSGRPLDDWLWCLQDRQALHCKGPHSHQPNLATAQDVRPQPHLPRCSADSCQCEQQAHDVALYEASGALLPLPAGGRGGYFVDRSSRRCHAHTRKKLQELLHYLKQRGCKSPRRSERICFPAGLDLADSQRPGEQQSLRVFLRFNLPTSLEESPGGVGPCWRDHARLAESRR